MKTTSTQYVMDRIVHLFRELPDTSFHPSLFTMRDCRARAGMPHAIRKLKEKGLLVIAAKNMDGQPLYKATPLMREFVNGSGTVN